MGLFMNHLLLNGNVGSAFGELHPLFVHFPIVLFTSALACDLLNGIGKRGALYVGHWLIIAAVIMCIPTIISGLEISEAHEPSELIEKHKFLGFSTGIMGSIYSGLRISVMWWKIYIKPTLYIGFSIIMTAMVSWTADYGALITHGTSLFSIVTNTS